MSIHTHLLQTREYEHARDVDMDSMHIITMQDQVDAYKHLFEKKPITIELHDRDPLDETNTIVYFAKCNLCMIHVLLQM